MPAEAVDTPGLPAAPAEPRRMLSDAAALLLRAAQPDRRHLNHGLLWLIVAAGLEALGPLIGKFFLDSYLLPHNADIPAIAGLLPGALLAGMAASYLRYLQLVRLAGLAMRSVRRIRENVYVIPLHRQMIPWAVRANVKVHHRPDNVVEGLWITVGK